MKNIAWSVFSIIGISAVFLSLMCICEAKFAETEPPLKCHVCDPDTCKSFNKNSEPKECKVDDLNRDNTGPSKLYNFSYIGFRGIDIQTPLFDCQKIEAYDVRGVQVVRKCQLRLPGNESCSMFYKNLNMDPERTYMNATCVLCNSDGCNSSGLIYIWVPLLLSSIALSVLMK